MITTFNLCLSLSLCLLIVGKCHALPKCSKYSACKVIETSYERTEPEEEEVVPEEDDDTVISLIEGSGEEGSGEGESTGPVYDELIVYKLVKADKALDEDVRETKEQALCTCPDEDNECAGNETTTQQFDKHISTVYCRPIVRKCKSNSRPIARLYGTLSVPDDGSAIDPALTYTMSSYTSANTFCRCDGLLRRTGRIESWGLIEGAPQYAFSYMCN